MKISIVGAALCAGIVFSGSAEAEDQQVPNEIAFKAVECIGGWETGMPHALAGHLTLQNGDFFTATEYQLASVQAIEVIAGECVQLPELLEDAPVRRYAWASGLTRDEHYELFEVERRDGTFVYLAVKFRPTTPHQGAYLAR